MNRSSDLNFKKLSCIAIATTSLCQIAFAQQRERGFQEGVDAIQRYQNRATPNDIPVLFLGNSMTFTSKEIGGLGTNLQIQGKLAQKLYNERVCLVLLKSDEKGDSAAYSGEGLIFQYDKGDSIKASKFKIPSFELEGNQYGIIVGTTEDLKSVTENLRSAVAKEIKPSNGTKELDLATAKLDDDLLKHADYLAAHNARRWAYENGLTGKTDEPIWNSLSKKLEYVQETIEWFSERDIPESLQSEVDSLIKRRDKYPALCKLSGDSLKMIGLAATKDLSAASSGQSPSETDLALRFDGELSKYIEPLHTSVSKMEEKLKALDKQSDAAEDKKDGSVEIKEKGSSGNSEMGKQEQPAPENLESERTRFAKIDLDRRNQEEKEKRDRDVKGWQDIWTKVGIGALLFLGGAIWLFFKAIEPATSSTPFHPENPSGESSLGASPPLPPEDSGGGNVRGGEAS